MRITAHEPPVTDIANTNFKPVIQIVAVMSKPKIPEAMIAARLTMYTSRNNTVWHWRPSEYLFVSRNWNAYELFHYRYYT